MSPAATITPDQAEEHILEAADALFYKRGVGDVTMADLRDTAQVSMRRLYSLYPTKADVVTAWLHHRHERWLKTITEDVRHRTTAGTAALDAVFDSVEDWLAATNFRGCAFINTHAEGDGYTPAQQQIVRSHKEAFAAFLSETVPDIPALAVLIDGAIVQASIFSSIEPLRSAHELARQGSHS